MAISHNQSVTIGDATGTVTQWFGATTITQAASDIVKPSAWNSAHNMFYTLIGNTTNQSTASGTDVRLSGAGGIILGGSTGTLVISAPVLPVFEPFPLFSGSANTSNQPASWWFNRVVVPGPVTVSNLVFVNSVNVGPPTATSQAGSSGNLAYSYSMGVTVFKRVDFAANSSRLTTVTTASLGMTMSVSFTGTSQQFSLSYVTDTTGGTTSTNTTSNAANWSSYLTGNKFLSVPLVTSFSVGEYFFAHAHSSTTGSTGNQNTTILSFSRFYIQPQIATVGLLTSQGSLGALQVLGFGEGVASAVTTNNTMAISVISQATRNWIYFNMSNA
jgi:hypothetical protein